MKRNALLIYFVLVFGGFHQLRGDEGMWLPLLMDEIHWEDMRTKGLKISPEEIFSMNQASLKDAVIHFGGGCTGMLVSGEGLMFTNHHCAYSRIQGHSTVEQDYLTDGFWAKGRTEEIPNPGLTASILVRFEDVTDQVLALVTDKMNEQQRAATIKRAIKALVDEITAEGRYEATIRPLYYGNQFILVVTEVFRDVRLVGAPPSSIGKFGRDTDNWMWPRHNGDFAIFRIYANDNNEPADYNLDNVPYKPKRFFEISARGINEGDFTMVYGFPGRTEQYLPAQAIYNYQHHTYPTIVRIRDHELDVINYTMSLSDELRIQYTARQASIANGWKLYRGVIPGLKRFGVIERKEEEQAKMLSLLADAPEKQQQYRDILEGYTRLYEETLPYQLYNTHFNECFWRNPLFRFMFRAYRIPDADLSIAEARDHVEGITAGIASATPGLYKTLHMETEQKILAEMVALFIDGTPEENLPPVLAAAKKRHQGDYQQFVEDLFRKSIFGNETSARKFFEDWKRSSQRKLVRDPLFAFMHNIITHYLDEFHPALLAGNSRLDSLHRLNMQMLLEVHGTGQLYPDANATLRIAYGQIAGSYPRDAVHYHHQTHLDGVFAKSQTGNPDYLIPERLSQIANAESFIPYSSNGTMPVAFIANNHTTGGNSGSPVLNNKGELIGINFDRAWDGTMSDLNFEPSICRNISVDIRYLLFITDRFGEAKHLLEEMVIHY